MRTLIVLIALLFLSGCAVLDAYKVMEEQYMADEREFYYRQYERWKNLPPEDQVLPRNMPYEWFKSH